MYVDVKLSTDDFQMVGQKDVNLFLLFIAGMFSSDPPSDVVRLGGWSSSLARSRRRDRKQIGLIRPLLPALLLFPICLKTKTVHFR